MSDLRMLSSALLLVVVAVASGRVIASAAHPTGADASGYARPLAANVPVVASQPTVAAVPPTAALATATSTSRPQRTPTPVPSATPAPSATALALADPATATPASIDYTVQKGDSLKAIAKRYGSTLKDIVAINQIQNLDSLSIGEVIHIPRR